MASMVDEKALLERARSGDREAFDGLVRASFPRVYAIAFRLVESHEDAEDLAQEVFVRAHRSLGWYRGEGTFTTWLYRITVHLARDRFRRASRRPLEGALPLAMQPATRGGGPAEDLARRELQRALVDSMRDLPERLRTPLVLRAIEGLDYDEVAAATGVKPDTARSQVMRARRALLRALRPFLPGASDVAEERGDTP